MNGEGQCFYEALELPWALPYPSTVLALSAQGCLMGHKRPYLYIAYPTQPRVVVVYILSSTVVPLY